MNSKLTKELALIELDKISGSGNESAHETEDSLYKWFIECVAENLYAEDELIEVAKLVLSARDIEYCRWYA